MTHHFMIFQDVIVVMHMQLVALTLTCSLESYCVLCGGLCTLDKDHSAFILCFLAN
jgi:hypothetical protein